jgi:hypothetical protein
VEGLVVIIVGTALRMRANNPISFGMYGAGFMARGITVTVFDPIAQDTVRAMYGDALRYAPDPSTTQWPTPRSCCS